MTSRAKRDAAAACTRALKSLDDAHITDEDRERFLTALQTFLIKGGSRRQPAFPPEHLSHWLKCLAALSTYVQTLGEEPGALQSDAADSDSGSDAPIMVPMSKEEFEIWEKIKKDKDVNADSDSGDSNDFVVDRVTDDEYEEDTPDSRKSENFIIDSIAADSR
jgi:hypothetical protein